MQRPSQSSVRLALALALAGCDPGILDPILTAGITTAITGDSSSDTNPVTTSTGDPDPGTTGGPATSEGTTSGGTTSGTTSGSTTGEGESDSNDSAAFIMPGDPPAECDVWAQDCPEGQKCSAHGPPPLGPDSVACVPVVPDPDQAGQPCQVLVEGELGPDTCDFGLYCWDVDPDTGFGTCVELCEGSANDPECDPGSMCLIFAVPLCVATCDPLLQDCEEGESCQSVIDDFTCLDIDPLPGKGTFESCGGQWECAAGLFCGGSEGAVECEQEQAGCCLPYCDITAANTCPGAGQDCLPWFEPGLAPPGLEHVGACYMAL